MVERKKGRLGGSTGDWGRGKGWEPVVILFESLFRYASYWYMLWLVSFHHMPIKMECDMFQLTVCLSKRKCQIFIILSTATNVMETCLQYSPRTSSLNKSKRTCLKCLASGVDVFSSPPTGSCDKDRTNEMAPVRLLAFRFWFRVCPSQSIGMIGCSDRVRWGSPQHQNIDLYFMNDGNCEIPKSWLSSMKEPEEGKSKLGRQSVGIHVAFGLRPWWEIQQNLWPYFRTLVG